jgi:hypothetical protein
MTKKRKIPPMPGMRVKRAVLRPHDKQPKRDNTKIKPEVVAATLIARLYRIKDDRVVDMLDRTVSDPLNILGFLMKYGVEPPILLLDRCKPSGDSNAWPRSFDTEAE